MKRKKFDCVELQHRGGALVRERLAGMTIEEEVAYWRERTRALRQRQAASRKAMGRV
jgi:hypothetical protein